MPKKQMNLSSRNSLSFFWCRFPLNVKTSISLTNLCWCLCMCASSSLLSGLFLASYLCLLKKKNRKERICPNSIKITHSTHHKTTVIKLINIFINISIKNGIINLCNKKCINHHQNITVDEKLAIKNLKANQDIIIQSAGEGGEIVIMNRNQYIKECKKQLLDSTF